MNEYGQIVYEEWLRTETIRAEVELDVFQLMPNHFHGIVVIAAPLRNIFETPEGIGAHGRAPLLRRPPKSLGSLVLGFKSATTKIINELRGTPGVPVWQRNYYEHIIRDERELLGVRAYVIGNPAKWPDDKENPQNW